MVGVNCNHRKEVYRNEKISNIFILTILGFVIFIGGVKASDGPAAITSLPTESGDYELDADISTENAWVINGKNITIYSNNHSIKFTGLNGIVLQNGASLTINGSNDTDKPDLLGIYDNKNDDYNVMNLIQLVNSDSKTANTLTLNDVYTGANEVNGILSLGFNNINVTNSTFNKLFPNDATILLDSKASINTINSPTFNSGYVVYFDTDLDKGTIDYQNEGRFGGITLGSVKHLPSSNNNVKNSFKITPKNNNEVESVSIKDNDDNNVAYTIENGEYTFTMPESAVTVTVKYKENSKSEDKEKSEDKVSEEKQESKDKNKNKTTNPKTSDTIVTSLIIIVLSLLGLDLLMMIKKKINN